MAERAESVAQGYARRLRALEAERAAEKIDSEAQFHKLERSYTSLRTERDELAATNAPG